MCLLEVDLTNTSSLTHLVLKEMNIDDKQPSKATGSKELLNLSFEVSAAPPTLCFSLASFICVYGGRASCQNC